MSTIASPFHNIVKNAISSAICIDDKYVSPYTVPSDEDNLTDSKRLYESFRKEGDCDLDIYKYLSYEEYTQSKNYLFKNKDLLIIDWELDQQAACKYTDTFRILNDAISSDSIQFITIYTHEEDIENISLKVFSYLNYDYSLSIKLYSSLCESLFIDDFIDDIDDFKIKLKKSINGFSINESNRRKIRGDIRNLLLEKLPNSFNDAVDKVNEEFLSTVRDRYNKNLLCKLYCEDIEKICAKYSFDKNNDFYSWLEMFLFENINKDSIKRGAQLFKFEEIQYPLIVADGTLITVVNKANPAEPNSNVQAENLYSTITGIVEKMPNKFSAFLSLELKHFYKNTINAIGRGIVDINEDALLSHAKSYNQETQSEEFYNFILSSWNSQMVYKMKENLKIIDIMGEEIKMHNKKPDDSELAKLNSFLTFSPNVLKGKRRIKFGDVFSLDKSLIEHTDENETDNENYKYLICITQDCDCLRPHKINNNFTFVSGKEIELDSALKNVEKEYYTFLDKDTIIEWTKKFFSLKLIGNNIFDSEAGINLTINEEGVNAQFLGNQKLEITQRLANHVFSNAMRIGVDLPHIS